MLFGRSALRLFALLLVAALPPAAVFAWMAWQQPQWLIRLGTPNEILVAAVLIILWVAVVQVLGGPLLPGAEREMLDIAATGKSPPSLGGDGRNGIVERMVVALEERNRQIAELATHVRLSPLQQDLPAVARATVATARSVTGDPTWLLVVLRSPDPALLPTGVYSAEPNDEAPDAVSEVHRWAATMEPDADATPSVRHGIGPWGAFVSSEVTAGEDLRASFLAPWEGRLAPSPAERGLLSLVGQIAATALEHGLLYARLRSQADELNRMAGVQNDFLRGVTHDLQSPLTSIGAAASELRGQPGLSAAAASDLETISHQAERLRRMVGQLLIASRLEAGAVDPLTEVFHAAPLIERTWAALRADRQFTLERVGIGHLTVGDPDKFEQVLWAILDNAVKYSPPGSPITVVVSGERNGGGAVRSSIQVKDAGSGMDAKTRARAFEQFYRAPSARRAVPDGSGVGLYAARGLVEAMRGGLELTSRLGQGTAVTISMPGEPMEDAEASSA
jgi:signal transduction histidine kinase